MTAMLAQIPAIPPGAEHGVWGEFLRSLGFAAAFGMLGIVLAIVAYRLFDWISPIDVERELGENKNLAVAILMAGYLVGVCLIISRAIGS
jgi:uncharacterized membrane protein YjfL (UPF0719 family)